MTSEGRRVSVSEAARESGINGSTLRARMRRGLTLEEAVAQGQIGRGNKSGKPRVDVTLHECFGEMLSIPEIARKYNVKEWTLRNPYIPIDQEKKTLCTIEEYVYHVFEMKRRYTGSPTGGFSILDDAYQRLKAYAREQEAYEIERGSRWDWSKDDIAKSRYVRAQKKTAMSVNKSVQSTS